MTTSYIKDRVQELKAQKKLDRAKEEAERIEREKKEAKKERERQKKVSDIYI
mgnify:CR=1 FL=1